MNMGVSRETSSKGVVTSQFGDWCSASLPSKVTGNHTCGIFVPHFKILTSGRFRLLVTSQSAATKGRISFVSSGQQFPVISSFFRSSNVSEYVSEYVYHTEDVPSLSESEIFGTFWDSQPK